MAKNHSGEKKRKWPIILLFIIVLLATAGGTIFFLWQNRQTSEAPSGDDNRSDYPSPVYSVMTGLEIADASLNSSPTFCVQIPNGSTDGARPQAGLTEAAVVFEAIAETGITRFAAIFQNPDTSVIGPVRSLRPYYLDWDTPFDCTVVHAGGSDEALAAIATGGQRDLDEDYSYMWREEGSNRLWNNLFTSPAKLAEFNQSKGYTSSSPQTFSRLSPNAAEQAATDLQNCLADAECETEQESAQTISINFGSYLNYNTRYSYDPVTNTYLRSYQTGDAHLVYHCPTDLTEPNTKSECGELVQVAPSAIAVMMVQEGTMADGYHEQISTINSGKAYIFQNGSIVEGTWQKSSQQSQIVFRNDFGEEISFTPGQLWIAAVPQFGSVDWE